MSRPRHGRIQVVAEARREEPLVANSVMGMLIFVVTETMLFAGLISAFTIIKSGALRWPPPGQPRLPVEETLINTAALLASGVFLYLAQRSFSRDPQRARTPMVVAMALGAFFVVFQGAEWVAMIRQGLTLTSSSLGSFFYLIVGIHALHAVAALGLLFYAWWRLQNGWLAQSLLATAQVFWYFVVGMWPALFLVVYL